ncbi:hypothetical protein HANVADRAFT_21244 [Hanseniaspora valbyensis NRRL Y-1626]|uniref:ENTH domain-containing protein n=1 Tax=Hanseniaspora valbyensis NRRL Y-1626 TaxID=766949 RepID=A0A1B7TIK8_9ASCO|nr:hypothetical protein HANVADRAFT_21244 [Hanseniaspora valbyensis NRRL Y-1626]
MNIDKITKKISNLGLHDIKNAARFTQNLLIQYEPYQVDIRRATNTDEWGPLQKHFLKIIRHRFQVPMYLITEYTLKRLVDHMANDSKNLYEKARKDYINYGLEYRVVFKCLVVVEWLILNSPTTKDVMDVLKCLKKHAIIFNDKVPNYKVLIAGDGKMEVHTRVIHNKNENIRMLITDKNYLKQERLKHKKQQDQLAMSGSINSYYNGESNSSSTEDLDGDDYYVGSINTNTNNANKTARSASIVDRQRSQRRQILREQIRLQEERRKKLEAEEEAKKKAPQNDLIDLLSFDSVPVSTPTPITKTVNEPVNQETFDNVWNNDSNSNTNNNNDDDDGFGSFQTESSNNNQSSSINIFADDTNITTNNKSSTNNNNKLSTNNPNDPFSNLLDLI